MKLKLILVIPFFVIKSSFCQYDFGHINPGLPDPYAIKPVIIEKITIDSIVTNCGKSFYENITRIIKHSDSSSSKYFETTEGPLLLNKKFGVFSFSQGFFDKENKITSYETNKYFFNDILIPFNKHITKSISIDTNTLTATCKFNYITKSTDSINLIINYWIGTEEGKYHARCSTENGTKLFETTSNYIDEEFKLLLQGYYDRKIYAR